MNTFAHLADGFSIALSMVNVLHASLGCVLGTLIGVLPGIGPVAAMAMLLPLTYALEPVSALIMLAGLYYGAQYGGSTTAILLNLPGEVSSIVTTLDGHPMAQRGRAGAALTIAAVGSFVAGCVGTLLIALLAAPMTELAFQFGPAEYTSLIVVGLIGAVTISTGSLLKSLAMTILGLLLGTMGTDLISGVVRFNFGITELTDGIGFVVVAMGMYGLTEIILNLSSPAHVGISSITNPTNLRPSATEWRRSWPAIWRGTALGSLLGVLPGGGALLASFASYTVEKKLTKKADEADLGQGNIRGVAGPESANNAGAQTAFIPMLTLGIPSNAVMAMLMGGMIVHNIQPGPTVITHNPELFWGLIASMWVGNLMLLILNLPLVGVWVRLLSIPYRLLAPAIVLFCALGIYVVRHSAFDLALVSFFAILGVIFHQLDCKPAPLLLGLILGPMLEEYLDRALVMSRGDWRVFVERPISLSMLLIAAVFILTVAVPKWRQMRNKLGDED